MKVSAIAAMAKNRVIGREGALPWNIPEDMKRFKELTQNGVVMMGRKTFESLPERFRPLPGRRNIVITSKPESMFGYNVDVSTSPIIALKRLAAERSVPQVWVIGGGELYRATMDRWDELYLTLVDDDVQGDAYFPDFEEHFELVASEPHKGFTFQRYQRRREAA